MSIYGWKTEDEARKHVKVYDKDYMDLLNDPNVEAVVVALPLHLACRGRHQGDAERKTRYHRKAHGP